MDPFVQGLKEERIERNDGLFLQTSFGESGIKEAENNAETESSPRTEERKSAEFIANCEQIPPNCSSREQPCPQAQSPLKDQPSLGEPIVLHDLAATTLDHEPVAVQIQVKV